MMKLWTLFLIAILAVFAVACGGVNDTGTGDDIDDDTSDDDSDDDDSGDDDNGNADDDDSDDDDNVDDDDDDDDSGDDDDDDNGDDDADDRIFAVDFYCPEGVVCVSYTYDYSDDDTVGVEITHRWSDGDWEYLEWYSWDYAEGDALWVCADDPDADLDDFDFDDEDDDSGISYTLAYADEGDCSGGTEVFIVPSF